MLLTNASLDFALLLIPLLLRPRTDERERSSWSRRQRSKRRSGGRLERKNIRVLCLIKKKSPNLNVRQKSKKKKKKNVNTFSSFSLFFWGTCVFLLLSFESTKKKIK